MTFTCPVSDKASTWVSVAVAARVLQVPEQSIHRWARQGLLTKRQFYDQVSRQQVVGLAAKLIHFHTDEPTDQDIKNLTGHGPQTP